MSFDLDSLRGPRELPIETVIAAHIGGIAFATAMVIGMAMVLASTFKAVIG